MDEAGASVVKPRGGAQMAGILKRGRQYVIRYYGPDGKQRWETVGPNRKQAETVLQERLHEVRSGKFPVLAKRARMTFAAFVEQWKAKHLVRVREDTKRGYQRSLKYHLLPVFGDRLLSAITAADVQDFIATAVSSRELAPKTVNNALALLKQIMSAAVEWGFLLSSPVHNVKKLRRPRRNTPLWTPAEIRRFLLGAPEEWRPMWLVQIFAGLRPSEVLPMHWSKQNWPDFTSNQIHVTCGYETTSKVLGPPKTDLSVRDVDMVPVVRQMLLAMSSRGQGALVFPRKDGRMVAYSTMSRAWRQTLKATRVRPIRPYDMRHIFASLLIMANKNPLYISRQMGHHSAGFTLDTYGHLIESLPKRQVEWIDDLVFPEGFERALKMREREQPPQADDQGAPVIAAVQQLADRDSSPV